MIKHLRIDNRLIHGQVAVAWMSYIGAQAIIVANDAVSQDPIQKMALPLAARGSKVLVFSIADVIQYAKDNPDETLFIICKFPSDALQILESGLEVAEVNVGNAAPVAKTQYKMVTNQIAATKEDAQIYLKIAQLRDGKLRSQMLPSAESADFLKLLRDHDLLD